jgi:hypothetical protein
MTKITALEVQHRIRRRQLDLRAMRRFSETNRFSDALESATDAQLQKLETILKSDSARDLKEWAREARNKPLCDCTMRELFDKAREKMIPKYSRLSKEQLIRALEKHGNATSVG